MTSKLVQTISDGVNARERLRQLLPEGSPIHVVTKSVSRGNASSVIDFFSFYFEPCKRCNASGRSYDLASTLDADGAAYPAQIVCPKCQGRRGEIRHLWLSRMFANLEIGLRFDAKHEGIRVGGHGHNRALYVRALYVLEKVSHALYGKSGAFTIERLG